MRRRRPSFPPADVKARLRRELGLDYFDWQGPNIGPGADAYPQGGDYAEDLEAIGRYRSGVPGGWGDVWGTKTDAEIEEYVSAAL